MPLPLANLNLDDRRWTDLVEEGRALIPRYAPGWTDHNLSDPGITLIELFAWLTDQSIYRLNQVPERHRLKFLGLIGFSPLPPQPAQTLLSIGSWNVAPIALPSGYEFEAADTEGQSVAFRTLRALTVAPVVLTAIQVEAGDGTLLDRTRDWNEGLPVAALGEEARLGAALYLGFRVAEGLDWTPDETPVSIALHFEGSESGPEFRARIFEEAAQQTAAQSPVLPDTNCDEVAQGVELSLPAHHAARVVWEVMTESGVWTPLERVVNQASPEPGQIRDDTRALTLDGLVEFNLPASIEPVSLGPVDGDHYWLRCRLDAGTYDALPLLKNLATNAVTAEQAVPIEHRFVISESAEIELDDGPEPVVGALVRLQLSLDENGVIIGLQFLTAEETDDGADDAKQPPIMQVLEYSPPGPESPGNLTLDFLPLGVGTGFPEQQATLPHAPVHRSTIELYTHLDDNWHIWVRCDDLDASKRTDRHFTLDATTGTIRFGDGERGLVPEQGALILASYHATRAEDGNLRAGSSFRAARTTRNGLVALTEENIQGLGSHTSNPLDAQGGMAAETLAHATGRAIETLHAHERLIDVATACKQPTLDQIPGSQVKSLAPPTRAVNLLDLERLALDVPGTQIARARAWAGAHPAYPCLHAAGVVTIVILPHLPGRRPEPSPGLLAAVRRYLDRRRMVATRLEVVGPRYLEVSVMADVRAKDHIDAVRVREQIARAIDGFLDPLTGGPERQGWPFGRDLYRSEILQLIDGVPGVDHVLSLRLRTTGAEPTCGNLALCPTWLIAPAAHRIRVNPAADVRPESDPSRPVCLPEPPGYSPIGPTP